MSDAEEEVDGHIESGLFYGHQVIRRVKYDELQAENRRLREALTSCQLAVENTNWGWDGDCGLGNHIGYIVETALEGGDERHD